MEKQKTIDNLMNDYIQGNLSEVAFKEAMDEIIEHLDTLPNGAEVAEATETIKKLKDGVIKDRELINALDSKDSERGYLSHDGVLESMLKENRINRLLSISTLPWLHVPATLKNRLSKIPYKRLFLKSRATGGRGEKIG